MELFLVQHGKAKSKEEDLQRPLTEEGRHEAESVAALASRMGVSVTRIRHSGKTRAEQTAMILAKALNPPQGVLVSSGLNPLDEVEPVARALNETEESEMLVGHMPFMERLAGQLVVGDPELAVVDFRNAGIVCLTRNKDHWNVAWNLTPEIALAKCV